MHDVIKAAGRCGALSIVAFAVSCKVFTQILRRTRTICSSVVANSTFFVPLRLALIYEWTEPTQAQKLRLVLIKILLVFCINTERNAGIIWFPKALQLFSYNECLRFSSAFFTTFRYKAPRRQIKSWTLVKSLSSNLSG